MKRFFQLIMAIKTTAAFAFTGGIMLLTVGTMLYGRDSISVSLIWQIIFLALIFGCLQFVTFSENTLGRMGTPGRMTVLGVSMLMVLAVFALIFRWFPMQSLVNWLVFIGLYVVAFLIATLALHTVFRLGGMKYNELLVAYKARRES
ncbi:hypothetical protein LJC63_04130 [Ruminococcaceae bacterium OttesenSCG-928-L11]|nr:hypothetical protein [Ruminococcaceae bacterium OttesenSCG-928-L11]